MSTVAQPSRLMQNLALANAAGDLRDALRDFIGIAIQHRDALLKERVNKDEVTSQQLIANHYLSRQAAKWTAQIEASQRAILKSEAGE